MPRALTSFALIFGLFGCTSLGWQSSSPVIDRVRESGQLRVGMTGDYPPLNMVDRYGESIGLEPDLARFLAQGLGVELVVVKLDFNELIEAIENGEVDAVLSGMTMTPERNQRVAFAGPYFISGKAVLTTDETLRGASEIRELDRTEVRLTALEGTTSESLIREALPEARLTPTRSYEAGVRMVIDGEADAMIADYPICVFHWALHRDKGLQAVPQPLTFEPIGVALPNEDPLFINLVQNYLASLEGTGLLGKLREQWFTDASWARELP